MNTRCFFVKSLQTLCATLCKEYNLFCVVSFEVNFLFLVLVLLPDAGHGP